MTTSTYPAVLPVPQVGLQNTQGDGVIRTDPNDPGNTVMRSRFSQVVGVVTLQWLFNADEMAIFEAWWVWYTLYGAKAFYMNFPEGSSVAQRVLRFAGAWKATAAPGQNYDGTAGAMWMVAAPVEVL